MKYLVMGAGALGSVFGGLLQEQGHEVTFVGRGRHLEAMQQHGLKLTGIWGEHNLPVVKAVASPAELSDTFDVVLLCVKSMHTAKAMEQVLPRLAPDGLVVSIQNGLGNWEQIAESAGWQRTVGARVIFGAAVTEPGVAEVTVYADKVLLGSPDHSIPMERIERITADLVDSGIPSATDENIAAAIWGKVLYNGALNPLGALLGCPYGYLGEREDLKKTMRAVVEEIFAVAHAKGITLWYETPEEYFHVLIDEQLPPTREHRASMLQDMELGRLTEIDSLNGAIVRYGRELDIPTPVNETITHLIHGMEGLRCR